MQKNKTLTTHHMYKTQSVFYHTNLFIPNVLDCVPQEQIHGEGVCISE